MKYQKKPIVVDAIRFDGTNFAECEHFIGSDNYDTTLNYPNIITSEGVMRVNKGDYIIKEPFDKERGFYPCKPEVFHETYIEVAGTTDTDGNFAPEPIYEKLRNALTPFWTLATLVANDKNPHRDLAMRCNNNKDKVLELFNEISTQK